MAVSYDVAQLIKAGADVYRAPIGTTLPATTLAIGAAWPAGWETMGLTDGPTLIGMEREHVAVDTLQQVPGIARVGYTMTGARLELSLAQLANVEVQQMAAGGMGTVTKVAAAAGVPGYEQFDLGGKIDCATPYMYGFESRWCDELGTVRPIRAYIWKGYVTEGWEIGFDRTAFTEGAKITILAAHDLTRPVGERLYRFVRNTADALP